MLRALSEAIDEGTKCVKRKHFESTVLSLNDRRQMLKECMDGENLLVDSNDTLSFKNDLYRLPSSVIENKQLTDNSPIKPKRASQRPGQRKPARDSIGPI